MEVRVGMNVGIKGHSTEDLEGSETLSHDTTKVDSHHYTFVKTHRTYNTKAEHYCTLETWPPNEEFVSIENAPLLSGCLGRSVASASNSGSELRS